MLSYRNNVCSSGMEAKEDSASGLRVEQVLVSERIGGAAAIAIRIAQSMRAAGGVSGVWIPGPGAAASELNRLFMPWRRYWMKQLNGNPISHGFACLHLGAGLMGGGRIVHVHSPSMYRLMRPALKLAQVTVVVHVHLEPGKDEIRWALRDPPNLIVTCAEYLIDPVREAIGTGRHSARVIAIPNAIDVERFYPGNRDAAKIALNARRDRPLILMMANLAPHKGHVTALHATALLRRQGILAHCWFAGEERDPSAGFRTHLEGLSYELGIRDQIQFLGFREDAPELLRAADILLLPSMREGLPLSILEAQATRTAVIGSPHPGIRDVIEDGATGFIVKPGDYQGYANQIQALVVQPRLYEQITNQAYNRVIRRHNWQTFFKKMLQAYRMATSPLVDAA